MTTSLFDTVYDNEFNKYKSHVRKRKSKIREKANRTIKRSLTREKMVLELHDNYMRDNFDKNIKFAKNYIQKAIDSMSVIENISDKNLISGYLFEGKGLTKYPDSVDVLTVHNLKIAWEEISYRLYEPLTLDLIIDMNKHIARDQALSVGNIRSSNEITVSGLTDNYTVIKPKVYEIENQIKIVNTAQTYNGYEEKVFNFFQYLILNQLFYDGNKRTAYIIANKLLISKGIGMLILNENTIDEFHVLLDCCFKNQNTMTRKKFNDFLIEKCMIRIK